MGRPHTACKDVAMTALSTGEWMWMSMSHSRDLVMSVSLPSWNFCTTFLWTWLSTVLFGCPCTTVFLGSPYSFSPYIFFLLSPFSQGLHLLFLAALFTSPSHNKWGKMHGNVQKYRSLSCGPRPGKLKWGYQFLPARQSEVGLSFVNRTQGAALWLFLK